MVTKLLEAPIIQTLQTTPYQLVFGKDMIHNIYFRANWDRIQKRQQGIINKSNQKENKNNSQIPYEYKVGDQVLLETPGILWQHLVQDHVL
jgi:hypothetical protein